MGFRSSAFPSQPRACHDNNAGGKRPRLTLARRPSSSFDNHPYLKFFRGPKHIARLAEALGGDYCPDEVGVWTPSLLSSRDDIARHGQSGCFFVTKEGWLRYRIVKRSGHRTVKSTMLEWPTLYNDDESHQPGEHHRGDADHVDAQATRESGPNHGRAAQVHHTWAEVCGPTATEG